MNEGVGVGPRISWDPVTDAGGTPPPPTDGDRSGFQFDLGGALSRLGSDEPNENGASPTPSGNGQSAVAPPPPPPIDEPTQPPPAPSAFQPASSPPPAPAPSTPPVPAREEPPATAGFEWTPTTGSEPTAPPVAPAPPASPAAPHPEPLPTRAEPPATAGFEWTPTSDPTPAAQQPPASPAYHPLSTQQPPVAPAYEPAPVQQPPVAPAYEPAPVQQPPAAPAAGAMPVQQPPAAPAAGAMPVQQPPAPPVIEPLPTRQPTAPVAEMPAATPVIEPLPTREPRSSSVIEPLPQRAPTASVIEPLPTRQPEPTRADGVRPLPAQPVETGPQPYVAPGGPSVFDEPAEAPSLPATPSAAPPPAADPVAQAPQMAPSLPAGEMPTLPETIAAVSPTVAEPIDSAPSTPDVAALRAAQLRASKNQRQGKLFGRSLLAFLIIGALVAGALLFGRAYLFSAEWDPALTPIVDDIQQSRGDDFRDPAPLVLQSEAEYSSTLLGLTIGTAWVDRLPEWRALGIAGSDATADSVAVQLTGVRTAVYDPSSNTIYQLMDADPAATADDLRWALEHAFAHQAGNSPEDAPDTSGFVGVSALRTIVRDAVDAALVEATVGRSPDVESLPLPIAYQVSASERLGAPLLAVTGLESTGLQPGDELPEAVYGLLDDQPANAASGLLQPGERALADPVALGDDDWSLVWGTRLPADFVDQLTDIVVADLYRPIDRTGQTCFVGVFETASEDATSTLFDGMLLWVSAGPTGSQGVASQLDATRVQLEACDPGSEATTPGIRPVDDLIDRQIARLPD